MVKVSHATVPGLSHDRDNEESCEDYIVSFVHEDVAVMCLCDGAGSAKYARKGAELVSSAVCSYLYKHHFSFEHMQLESAKKKIAEIAKSAVEKETGFISDYNCTLLAVIIKRNKYMCLHIGDGIIGCLDNNELRVLSYPSNGEYKNQTYFVTEQSAEKHIRIERGSFKKKKFSVFVMSDGTAVSFFQNEQLISKSALNQICEANTTLHAEEMNNFLRENLYEVISQNTNDDCSIGIISAN